MLDFMLGCFDASLLYSEQSHCSLGWTDAGETGHKGCCYKGCWAALIQGTVTVGRDLIKSPPELHQQQRLWAV